MVNCGFSAWRRSFLSGAWLLWMGSLAILFSFRAGAAESHTQASLISEKRLVAAGEKFDVGILLRMEPHWHTYSKDPGDSGLPTSVEWKLPKGVVAGPIRWPKPQVIQIAGLTSYGYETEVLLFVRIQIPLDYKGDTIHLEGKVDWLECRDICIPGSAVVSKDLKVGKTSENSSPEIAALFEKYRALIEPAETTESPSVKPVDTLESSPVQVSAENFSASSSGLASSLGGALAGAFLGGMLLNLMPCVLPVVAIKILSFVRQSRGSPRRSRQLGLAFALGILVSFWSLALIVTVLQTAGRQIGWGFQFHDPRFLMAMALVVTMVALNFFGVFEWVPGGLDRVGRLASGEGLGGAFFNGVLATTLATPCTAPFLAPALGFAFSQAPLTIFMTFTSAAVGLAFPYAVLAWEPRLLKWLPQPGAWMLHFKQAMGFPMLGTALWLVWVIGSSYGTTVGFAVAGWLLFAAFGIWLLNIFMPSRSMWICCLAIAVGMAGYRQVSPLLVKHVAQADFRPRNSAVNWQPYSKQTLEHALQTSQVVLVDFTADWCLTCKVNERTTLDDPRVIERLKELQAITLVADWTQGNDEITRALQSFKRSGVPLYVLYPGDRRKPPILLPQILTPGVLLKALDETARSQP